MRDGEQGIIYVHSLTYIYLYVQVQVLPAPWHYSLDVFRRTDSKFGLSNPRPCPSGRA